MMKYVRSLFALIDGRSGKWPALARCWLKAHPACAICGRREGCVPHHKIPVHVEPTLELDETNLVTLCEAHHLIFGHLGDWDSWNPVIDVDVETWRGKFTMRPYIKRVVTLLLCLILAGGAIAQPPPKLKVNVSVADPPAATETIHVPLYKLIDLSLPGIDMAKSAIVWDVFPEGKADFRDYQNGTAIMTGPQGTYTIKGLVITVDANGKPSIQRVTTTVQIGGPGPRPDPNPPPVPPTSDLAASIKTALAKEPADQAALIGNLAAFYDEAQAEIDKAGVSGWLALFGAMRPLAERHGIAGKLAAVQNTINGYMQTRLLGKAYDVPLAKEAFRVIAAAIRASVSNKIHLTHYKRTWQ